MDELQAFGMQQAAGRGRGQFLGLVLETVLNIAQHRASDFFQMTANLMGSARNDLNAQQAERSRFLFTGEPSLGRLIIQGFTDMMMLGWRTPAGNGHVLFPNVLPFKYLDEFLFHRSVSREEKAARGVFIQSVDKAGFWMEGLHLFTERLLSGSGNPGRLADHEKVRVLVEKFERGFVYRFLQVDFNLVALVQFVLGHPNALSIYRDPFLIEEVLGLTVGQVEGLRQDFQQGTWFSGM